MATLWHSISSQSSTRRGVVHHRPEAACVWGGAQVVVLMEKMMVCRFMEVVVVAIWVQSGEPLNNFLQFLW